MANLALLNDNTNDSASDSASDGAAAHLATRDA
jgi:hypothetical protein